MDIKTKDLNICVMESIRIQVQYNIRYFTNYFLTLLENCLVYIFLSIVTSVDALNICAARHMWPLIKIIKHKQESANLKKGLRKKRGTEHTGHLSWKSNTCRSM